MAERQTRTEATHRQRAAQGHVTMDLPLDEDGYPMAIVTSSASDLIPTVQFGNVLLQSTITRAVRDRDGDDALVEIGRKASQIAQAIVGSERRVLQWAIDPSLKVLNPSGTPVDGVPSIPGQPVAPPAPTAPAPTTEQPAPKPAPELPTPPSAQ